MNRLCLILLLCWCSTGLFCVAQPWTKEGALRFGQAGLPISAEGIRHDDAGEPYLLLAPYPPVTDAARAALQEALPRRGARLLDASAPYTILAVGDSVTATGPYPEIVARHLEQLTGRAPGAIEVRRAAYPGKSVDAAVRRWKKDSAQARADLVLIMFGLNDQSVSSPPEAFVGQLGWLVSRGHEAGADVAILEPTPHINIIPVAGEKGEPPAKASIFRTIGFAGQLQETSGTPIVVPSFLAIWGKGTAGGAWAEQARHLYPLFPTHYRKPWSTLEETNGVGDTIHPNIAGHAKIARAVVDRLLAGATPPSSAPLQVNAQSRWRADGRLESRLSLHNPAAHPLTGVLRLYPFPQDDRHEALPYHLAPGERHQARFLWPKEVDSPAALLRFPATAVCLNGTPWLQLVDLPKEGGSRPWAIPAPLEDETRWTLSPTQSVAITPEAVLTRGDETLNLPLPTGQQVSRLPVGDGGQELTAVRFASAATGEAVADGDLSEWNGPQTLWTPLGEPAQARWNRGPRDFRAAPEACQLHWAFRAGEEGLWVAFRGRCDVARDHFWLMFDGETRAASAIGTPAPYTWVNGRFHENGTLTLRPGDSSPKGAGKRLHGRWKPGPGEGEVSGELFIPYAVLDLTSWPDAGDLGLSIVWVHAPEGQETTYLLWSADGFPWNSTGFGVLRRGAKEPLPWKLRLR